MTEKTNSAPLFVAAHLFEPPVSSLTTETVFNRSTMAAIDNRSRLSNEMSADIMAIRSLSD